MKQYLPFVLSGLGVVMIIISFVLKNGTGDADSAITTLAHMFMLAGGIICLVGGVVTYFMRHDPEVW